MLRPQPAAPADPLRGARGILDAYTGDVTRDDFRLLTRDARDAWRFHSRGIDEKALSGLPWHVRTIARLRLLLLAFSLKLSPARRLIYAISLVFAVLGLVRLFQGFAIRWVPAVLLDIPALVPLWRDGTGFLLIGFLLVNLLVFLEVTDRLSLKNDLEVAREIQQSMLPQNTYRAPGVETHGQTRPANTVGGDFYDIQPLPDGRLLVAVGDVAGKGSPAALLMALLLAILRTLLDEGLEPAPLMARLNTQIWRHAPRSRFITLFLALYDPRTGTVTYANAGHLPPIVRRADGTFDRVSDGGLALGITGAARYSASQASLGPGDVLVLYSDGITEAENPDGVPFDEASLQSVIASRPDATAPDLGAAIFGAVAAHAQDTRFADDLTVLVLRRLPPLPDL